MLKKWCLVATILSLTFSFTSMSAFADDEVTKEKAVEKTGKKAKKKKTDKKETEKKDDEKAEDKIEKADRFAVPDGDADELIKFIEKLSKIQPRSREEFIELMKKRPAAIKKAAEKVLELDKDEKSLNHLIAKGHMLSTGIRTKMFRGKDEEKAELYKEVLAHLKAKGKHIDGTDYSMASNVARGFQYTGKPDKAAEAYKAFAKLLAKSDNKAIAKRAKRFEGAARLAGLVGKQMVLKGKTLDGKEWDIKDLKGKYVLVDFWASWCGPCRAEFPRMKKLYKAYNTRDFEIIGVNLDQTRKAVNSYLEKDALPWKHLYEDKAGFEHPMSTYYGIMGIPQMILVGKDGKVISIRARGAALEKLLLEKIGPLEVEDGKVNVTEEK